MTDTAATPDEEPTPVEPVEPTPVEPPAAPDPVTPPEPAPDLQSADLVEPGQPEAPVPQPEPTVIGHQVVQDNVSEPGTERTVNADGETAHSPATDTEAPAADAPEAEDAAPED